MLVPQTGQPWSSLPLELHGHRGNFGLVFVALLVLYFMLDKRRSWLRNSLIFVVAGGVGNFVDRILYLLGQLGGVRDMVRLRIFVFNFGVCNFADFFIVGGGIVNEFAVFGES